MKIYDLELIEPRLLKKSSSVREGFESLNGKFGMVLCVLDDNDIFCGLASDGDLRHHLLKGGSLDDSLHQVMNKEPVVLSRGNLGKRENYSFIQKKFESKGIDMDALAKVITIPVLDKSKRVLGLVTTEMLDSLSLGKEVSQDRNRLQSRPHILLIGGAGFIGSVLAERLLERDWRVRVLDNLIYDQDSLSSFLSNSRFSFIHGDVCNLHTQVEAIKGVDCVVFLAEIVGDPSCEYLPQTALKTNYLAVNSMATLCAHTNVNRFVYTSSCSVYGASTNPEKLLDEHSALNPVSHYARMKIHSEQALFNQLNPMFSPTILRLATVYGHSHRPRFDLVVNTFARNAFFDKTLTVNGGDQWRPNVHVKDVARAITTVIEAPIKEVQKKIFNVGGNRENHTIKSLAELTKTIFPQCRVSCKKSDEDLRNYRVSFDRIRNILDFEPEYSVSDGLKELKSVFESDLITEINDPKYSNIASIMEKELK